MPETLTSVVDGRCGAQGHTKRSQGGAQAARKCTAPSLGELDPGSETSVTILRRKGSVKEGFLRRGAIPDVIGCTDGSLIAIIAPNGERNTAFMSRKGYYAENCMFICDADVMILTVYPMRPGSDHDSFVWRTTWLRRRFKAGRIANPGDSGYPLDPWLLTPVSGHPPMPRRSTTQHMAPCVPGTAPFSTSQNVRPTLSLHVLCCTHNLRLSEGDKDESDDDSSTSSSSELCNNGDPIPHGLPRNRGSRLNFLRGWAVRDSVIGMFDTTRAQHMHYFRSVRLHLRRQQDCEHR
ncbi:hypothetical protein HPB49_005500 [Dermacentor silvarum]|uniref:Uncharacterized protein n=1 Tax=Dermacentor silvarum TaxID=543639 RepID=A0ACB8DUX8_DERSI|nr:hypothetical protein HPB49_005500 [Dermacentor silvarum]